MIKVFFANLKRGGILLIQIAVGSLYMFSVPRGYLDGFYQWCSRSNTYKIRGSFKYGIEIPYTKWTMLVGPKFKQTYQSVKGLKYR